MSIVDLIVADDSSQTPSRTGMKRKLVAVGGLHIPSETVRDLERGLNELCTRIGFPSGEEFKWSPNKKHWMQQNLVGKERTGFFVKVLDLARQSNASAIVVVVDTRARPANRQATSPEEDAMTLFLERAQNQLASCRQAIVVIDQPGGTRKDETKTLRALIERTNRGTSYASLDRLAIVVAANSSLLRLLQLADLVVGCTLSFVSGERRYSPPVFATIKEILRSQDGRIGGVGLKIHPDGRYANLYHWLLGDRSFQKRGDVKKLPLPDRPYACSPDAP